MLWDRVRPKQDEDVKSLYGMVKTHDFSIAKYGETQSWK